MIPPAGAERFVDDSSQRTVVSTAAELLAQATARHRAGELAAAMPFYEQLLASEARDAEGHYLRGVAYGNLGKTEAAFASLSQAVRLKPDHAEAHNHLGALLGQQGRLDEAIASFERARAADPNSPTIRDNLSAALAMRHNHAGKQQATLGDVAAAVNSFRQAVQCNPAFAAAHSNLGTALAEQDQMDEAIACQRRAIELQPDMAEAHNSLGAALMRSERFDEAIACFHQALELKPDYFKAHNNLGTALAMMDQLDAAVEGCRRAIELRPDFAEAYNSLATVLSKQEQSDDAIAAWRRALELKPDFAEAARNLGVHLAQQGRTEEAKECYLGACSLPPGADVWRLNALSLCPAVFDGNEQIDRYRHTLVAELDRLASASPRFDPAALAASGFVPSFNLQFHGHDERPIRQAYSRLLQDSFPVERPAGSTGRGRVGFVVTDGHEHAFARSLGPVLAQLNPERLELVILASRRGVDALRSEGMGEHIRFRGVTNQLDRWVEAVRDARCDVLYYWEIGTDSINYLLPYYRLAQVQCTSWGIQLTSGIGSVDYYLSSALAEPADAAEHYTEKLLLADTLLTCRRRAVLSSTPLPREAFGIRPGLHVYLCAQQLGKLQPDFDPILAEILRRDEAGEILLLEDRRDRLAAEQLRARFAARHEDVAGRIRFVPFQSASSYLSLVAAADVLLDPIHFGGVNSTYDGLSLGQPIVTLPSRFQRGRYTLGCYRKLGVLDCVARDAAHYVEIAVALCTQADYRAQLADKIRRASPALFDDGGAVSEHERIFSQLVDESRSKATA
jgi:predicted O-linked N-acetylglucosamine transferase (SPINDLY family)